MGNSDEKFPGDEIGDGQPLDHIDVFALAVERCLGERIRAEDEIAHSMWSALANVEWIHVNGETASYSLHAAGGLVADIRGMGNYLDWYCRSRYNTVSPEIGAALATMGWAHIEPAVSNETRIAIHDPNGKLTYYTVVVHPSKRVVK